MVLNTFACFFARMIVLSDVHHLFVRTASRGPPHADCDCAEQNSVVDPETICKDLEEEFSVGYLRQTRDQRSLCEGTLYFELSKQCWAEDMWSNASRMFRLTVWRLISTTRCAGAPMTRIVRSGCA